MKHYNGKNKFYSFVSFLNLWIEYESSSETQ